MSSSRRIVWIVGTWIFILIVYSAMSLSLKHGSESLSTFSNLVQCLIPLLANAGLLLNAGTPHWRRNIFWMLLAMSCTLWMIGKFEWTYYEVYLHRPLPEMYAGDILFFLRGMPMMAALALRPHLKRGEVQLRFGYLDFVLLLVWWTFLYVFVVLPWLYATPALGQYNRTFNLITNIQNMVIVVGWAILWLRSSGAWRIVYANLFGASTIYMFSSLTINVAIDNHRYYTGSLYDLPLVSSFLWFALAGVIAYQNHDRLDAPSENAYDSDPDSTSEENVWPARLAMAAVISLPLFAIYTLRFSHDDAEVRDFRLMATLLASIPLALLIFVRTHLADRDRSRLLARSEQSIENLKRLQAQIVQSEKLVSLGQLAAGAAHEINNPLAAILGFSDLLAGFARQVPAERTLLDINTVVNNAVQLRALDLRSETTRIELQLESVLPGVRGDGNQLMQVFFNIISNALEAMEAAKGGVLTIKTLRDRSNVVILFSDTGPGLKDPQRVFDPFYTTKPVGKGTGLGLSICFGIVQEHGGKILSYNRQEGGAVFRVELPALLAAFPAKELQLSTASTTRQKPS